MATYHTLNEIILDSNALIHNFNYFQKLNPAGLICPVLKSNAYGHGLVEIAKILEIIPFGKNFPLLLLFTMSTPLRH
jgi:alanine racemase